MKLRDYLAEFKLDRTAFAFKAGIPYPSLVKYCSGERKPRQKVAEKIEEITYKVVTVHEMRGKDDRDKRKPRPSNEHERSGQEVSRHQASSF